ncbi:YgaP family membrane protein [Acidithiobacillus sulfuriphilus]|uniref:YgaP family membrane protein n=1 Tax=Acidithiobacillus sulfuriphilus TaxID=1867749 RepID=UPI003F5E5F47
MIYVKNLPLWERLLRIGFGVAVVVYAAFNMGGALGWVVAVCGLGAALTGIFGFCPACALAGRRLKQRARPGQTTP